MLREWKIGKTHIGGERYIESGTEERITEVHRESKTEESLTSNMDGEVMV